ncbi:MAG TPA: 4-alpha-glucanotransferase [Mycobacteriales bacterium]|nr:4-alpha-glucanotransferase [Mycobacteriales bacterium]
MKASPGRPSVLARPDLDPDLARLADAHGVATWYEDQAHRPVAVHGDTLVAVLDALGVDASSPDSRAAALRAARSSELRRVAPPVVVSRSGAVGFVELHAPAGVRITARIRAETGRERAIPPPVARGGLLDIDGARIATLTLALPGDLPIGWHRLLVDVGEEHVEVPVAVTPYRLPPPDRTWGWAVQLYATRSAASWGVGDLADLRRLAGWSAHAHHAGLLLVNPLHAVAPVTPVEPSPYSPASRRFINPVYIRVADTPEYAAASPEVRAAVDAFRPAVDPDIVDRDRTWRALSAALRLLWRSVPHRDLSGFREAHPAVDDFALWSVLAAEHGRHFRSWPVELRRPRSAAVDRIRAARADDVDFQVWLQLVAAEQLDLAQRAGREAGMSIGIIHDLAVGVDPGGADAWALQDLLAGRATMGAPPDEFNQQGQDWRLPPWHPAALRESAYAPFREIVRAAVQHGGGIRVDHILGLFRLWWVPAGRSPADGTYVRYRADELLGVLALEAYRGGAVVVGEDLGTVEPQVARELLRRGILGSAVLWFESEPFERWRELAVASVTTHDLPTAAGFLAGEHVRVRAELGQLRRPVAAERAAAEEERLRLVERLERSGLAEPGASPEQLVTAMYAGLARSPARLVVAGLADAVGDLRQPNLPGTTEEYPNWRLPIAEPRPPDGHRSLSLDELETHPAVARLARVLADGIRGGGSGAARPGSGTVPADQVRSDARLPGRPS